MENKEKKSKGKTIIIIMLSLVIVSLAAFGGAYMFMQNKDKKEIKIEQGYQDLGEFMVNLDGDEKNRYVKAHVSVGFDKNIKGTQKLLEERIIPLRDAAIFYIKGRSAIDFRAEKEEGLKSGLKEGMNKVLEEPHILDVYITDIIVQ